MADSEHPRGEVRGTLEGITRWTFDRAMERLGKGDSAAFTWLLDRLLMVDGDYLERALGVSYDAYEKHVQTSKVVQLRSEKKSSA